MIYKYTGKPSKTQTFSTRYKAVTNARWTPPKSGLLMSKFYLNLDYKLKAGRETGTIRVRVVRESPNDPSAYQDFVVSKNGVTRSYLLTHVWFEVCEGGRPLHWEVRLSDDFEYGKGTTRYSGWALL